MNSVVPTGGVYRPMARLTTIMMPSCTGSMPMLCASGRNTGVSSSTAAGRSMNMPMNSIITFISAITTHLVLTFCCTHRAMFCGIWSNVSSQPMAADAMITSSTTPVASPASRMAWCSRFHDRSWYSSAETAPENSVDSTATSVGVAMPKRRKTTIITGSAMAGSDSTRLRRNAALSAGAVSRGRLSRRPTYQQAVMKPPHSSSPGSTPA